jgi:uncharacterized protein (DUF1697 family)
MHYVALLRGINVGGKNLIAMPALKACFERIGYTDVATYIQSGNVLFSAPRQSREELTRMIEAVLSQEFDYNARVIVISQTQLTTIVKQAPPAFGSAPAAYRYDVIFLKIPFSPPAILRDIPLKTGVDTIAAGPGVLYFSRLVSKASQSRLSKIISLPVYQFMTIRNWNTTTKLLALMHTRNFR